MAKRGSQRRVSGWKREFNTRTQLSFSSTCALRTLPAKDPYPSESSGVETSQENRAGREPSVRMR